MKTKVKVISYLIGVSALMVSGAAAAGEIGTMGDVTTVRSDTPAGELMMVEDNSAAAHADHQYPPYSITFVSSEQEIDLAPIEFTDDQELDSAVLHADHQYPPYAR